MSCLAFSGSLGEWSNAQIAMRYPEGCSSVTFYTHCRDLIVADIEIFRIMELAFRCAEPF